ncbi:FAD binding domain-containing protein [Candidatus Formimonas warabiya]|uniref:FAD-binding PCMH-type domain-containing protein n=1 Tax=Formimonas warabiya TaxID=1761012 RepID=A0A3G1KVJ5_FORW1|nr:FAD binding domain-containing protein [Candidatus Formimonas warabiya]ATW26472.1 hypothetical protein DCMF_18495 [Candidatus Formimonas warabiya]
MRALADFDYLAPASWAELWAIVKGRAGDVLYLVGGTDLLIDLRTGKKEAGLVIDLKKLPDMRGITVKNDRLWVGALTTIAEIENSPLVRKYAAVLAQSAGELGSWQVRNRGTIGGNLCNGLPTADTSSPVLALGAKLHYRDFEGDKKVDAADFWLGAGKTVLNNYQVLTSIEIPISEDTFSSYAKLGTRDAMEIAVISVASVLRINNGIIADAGIAVGGGGPVPILARSAMAYLKNKQTGEIDFSEAGRLVTAATNPRTSARASREYRLQTFQVVVERSLAQLLRQAG